MAMSMVVSFHTEPEGLAHAAVRASGAPRAGLLTLCGLPVTGMTARDPYPVMYEKVPGVPAEPFFTERGCLVCRDGLSE